MIDVNPYLGNYALHYIWGVCNQENPIWDFALFHDILLDIERYFTR